MSVGELFRRNSQHSSVVENRAVLTAAEMGNRGDKTEKNKIPPPPPPFLFLFNFYLKGSPLSILLFFVVVVALL